MSDKIKNLLTYVGTIGAVITSIAYIVVIAVIVMGIDARMQTEQILLVSILGAVFGLLITLMLRGQGVALAKNEPGVEEIMKAYEDSKNSKKKSRSLHTIKWFNAVQMIKDIFVKVVTVAIGSYFSIVIFMEGNGDFALIGLALVNTLLFFSFGILALVKAYNFYLSEHLSAIKELTKRNITQAALVPSKEVQNAEKQSVQSIQEQEI